MVQKPRFLDHAEADMRCELARLSGALSLLLNFGPRWNPRFLLHDNDGIFGLFRDRKRRGKKGRRYRCRLDLWLADVMKGPVSTGITGPRVPVGGRAGLRSVSWSLVG
jgi:hypothetical protein